MKYLLSIIMICSATFLSAQYSKMEKEGIERACLNYLEGFYEGDTTKLMKAIKPSLYKTGYWKDDNGLYKSEGQMTYQKAIDYAKKVSENQTFAKAKAPKSVEVLSMSNHIACAKITAWWGIDYALLSKTGPHEWIIEQVLWEGPLDEK